MDPTSSAQLLSSRFRPGELWPDAEGIHINAHGGGLLFHNDRYFWFGEHKIAGEAGNAAHVGVRCYSSADLHHWKNEGVALAISDDPQSPIARGCILERPKVLFCRATQQFVMWFHLEQIGAGYNSALAGVVVSHHITGPYRFLHALRPNAGIWPMNAPDSQRQPLTSTETHFLSTLKLEGGPIPNYPTDLIFRRDFINGQMSRDMTLFLDDDGRAYHLHASEDNGVLHISQLADDFCRPADRYFRFFPGRFHEAPALFRHHNKYFLITSGCTGWRPNAARLSSADSLWGPWTELGNPCRGTPDQVATTFNAQSTFVLPIQGKPDAFIFMADRWNPQNAIDGRYVWLPIQFENGIPFLEWRDSWGFDVFEGTRSSQ
jgi:hypothetical protein